jgi:hypothetical protein
MMLRLDDYIWGDAGVCRVMADQTSGATSRVWAVAR